MGSSRNFFFGRLLRKDEVEPPEGERMYLRPWRAELDTSKQKGTASHFLLGWMRCFKERQSSRLSNRRRFARIVHSDVDPGSRLNCLRKSDVISRTSSSL